MYAAGRFLGGWTARVDGRDYADESTGGVGRFTGLEAITRDGVRAYELRYLGGTVAE